MANPAPRKRTVVWISVGVVFLMVIAAVILLVSVAAGVTCPDGHLGTILRYKYGDPIRIMVTVPDYLTPTAIQTVVDGNPNNIPGTPAPWDVKSTGRTYVLDYGPAGESPLTVSGTHNVYAIVTFSDNSMATSNVVYFIVSALTT